MNEVHFLKSLHTSTKRDYMVRVNAEKPSCMRMAKKFGFDYWDGDRKYGYGGYRVDGRWNPIMEEMCKYYGIDTSNSVLDIGCGKASLLGEFEKKGLETRGIDISHYALMRTKESVLKKVTECSCTELPYGDWEFDFVYSINVFHNLGYKDLKQSIQEMVRVGKEKFYICVESYRNEDELCNLQAWQLTCLSYYSPDDWRQIFEDNGYKGDYELIFFT